MNAEPSGHLPFGLGAASARQQAPPGFHATRFL